MFRKGGQRMPCEKVTLVMGGDQRVLVLRALERPSL